MNTTVEVGAIFSTVVALHQLCAHAGQFSMLILISIRKYKGWTTHLYSHAVSKY